jgi:hypothetical protein
VNFLVAFSFSYNQGKNNRYEKILYLIASISTASKPSLPGLQTLVPLLIQFDLLPIAQCNAYLYMLLGDPDIPAQSRRSA